MLGGLELDGILGRRRSIPKPELLESDFNAGDYALLDAEPTVARNVENIVEESSSQQHNNISSSLVMEESTATNQQQDWDVGYRQSLMNAILSGNLGYLRTLLAERMEVLRNIRFNENEDSLLHLSVQNSQKEVARWLAEICPELLTVKNKQYSNPVHYAAQYGNLSIWRLEELKNMPAEVMLAKTNQGDNAMHIAAKKFDWENVKALMSCWQQLSYEKNNNGKTPVMIAAEGNSVDCVRMVAQTCPRVLEETDEAGRSVLHIAAQRAHTKILKVAAETEESLLDKQDKELNTVLHYSVTASDKEAVEWIMDRHPEIVTVCNNKMETPLHQAAKNRDTSMMMSIISRCPDAVTKLDGWKLSVLMIVLLNNEGSALAWQIIGALLPNNLMPNERVNRLSILAQLVKAKSSAWHGEVTPLHIATKKGLSDLVKKFLELSPEAVGVQSIDGSTALHIAAETSTEILKDLLSASQDDMEGIIDLVNAQGRTAMHLAASKGNFDSIFELYKKNKNVLKVRDARKNTVLHFAATNKSGIKLLALLEKENSHLELFGSPNDAGDTILHIAVRNKNSEFVTAICKSRPDLLTIDNEAGDMPLHVACKVGFETRESPLLIPAAMEHKNKIGNTPLHIVVEMCGSSELFNTLLNACPTSQKEKNEGGEMPVHIAIRREFPNWRILLQNLETDAEGSDGEPFLLYLAQRGARKEGDCWVGSKQINWEVKNQDGNTALHISAENGSYSFVQFLLLRNNRLATIQNYRGDLAVHLAARKGHAEIVNAMITNREIATQRDSAGDTLLHIAMKTTDAKFVERITGFVNDSLLMLDNDGNTPLHLACLMRWYGGGYAGREFPKSFAWDDSDDRLTSHEKSVIKILSGLLGSNSEACLIQNNDGKTPLHLAAEVGRRAPVMFLAHKCPETINRKDNDGNFPYQVHSKTSSDAVEWLDAWRLSRST